jgi:glucans biosynthesis protein
MQPKPGEAATFAYAMYWYGENPQRPPGGRVVATRRDKGTLDGAQRFVIDFEGGDLQTLSPEQTPKGVVTVADDGAAILDEHIVKNPVTGGWRLAFQIRPKKKTTVELRAFLERDSAVLTETWSYAIEP